MTYCADDVSATHAIYKKMWPQFKTRYCVFIRDSFVFYFVLVMFCLEIK